MHPRIVGLPHTEGLDNRDLLCRLDRYFVCTCSYRRHLLPRLYPDPPDQGWLRMDSCLRYHRFHLYPNPCKSCTGRCTLFDPYHASRERYHTCFLIRNYHLRLSLEYHIHDLRTQRSKKVHSLSRRRGECRPTNCTSPHSPQADSSGQHQG